MRTGVAYIILAAGNSSRLGVPKQFLKINGKPLIRVIAEICDASHPEHLFVISGAHHREMKVELEGLTLNLIHNPAWAEGISASIRLGVHYAAEQKMDAALLVTCDQIKITTKLLNKMVDVYKKDKPPIVCCQYAGRQGIPALFRHSFFPALMDLRGDMGAKALIEKTKDRKWIDFPGGELDIDEPGDLKLLD
ncbi:MAG: nucleotidyltransferase family protein [Chitinophagales bacterium]